MKIRILIAVIIAMLVSPIAFGQGMYGGASQSQSHAPAQQPSGPGPMEQTKTTTTKKVAPAGVKGYLDAQMASSKDKKFHVSLNGKDVAMSPVTFHQEQKLSGGKGATAVDMRGADGKIYEIDFVTSNGQVTGAKVGKIDGKAP